MSVPADRLGPWIVEAVLGRGGMGVVYRARHETSGETAAVKTVGSAGTGALEGIRREVHALARLRHPGIVRILGEGLALDGGRGGERAAAREPWYAMEMLAGRCLRAFLDAPGEESSAERGEAPVPPEASGLAVGWWTSSLAERSSSAPTRAVPPPQAAPPAVETAAPVPVDGARRRHELLRVVRRLCAPLSYLHGEGIVHRDLKPENVILVAGGRPVIVDFGLATRFTGEASRELVDSLGELAGTVAYMAPEQARGEPVDARADLYALGCMLYEVVVGHPPFTGPVAAVLYQHVQAPPVPPSALAPEVSPELEALVMALLEKAPGRRLGHAGTVEDTLARMGIEDGCWAGAPAPRAYLYRPGLGGRQEALAALESALARVEQDASGALVLVEGESGVGKTRLLTALAERARERGAGILAQACPERCGPLEPWLALVERVEEALDPDAPGGTGTPHAGLDGATKALDEPADPHAGGAPTRPADVGPRAVVRSYQNRGSPASASATLDLSDPSARRRLFGAVVAILGAHRRRGATVVIVDDLQWADEVSLEQLAWLEEQLGAIRGLLVVGAYRTEEAPPALAALRCHGSRLRLDRLGPGAVAGMTADMLAASPPPAELCDHIWRHSQGNPLFVAEYLRAALEMGLLVRDPEGRWQEAGIVASRGYGALAVPRSLGELIERRLHHLSPDAREVLDAASVAGGRITEALLATLLPLDGERRMAAETELTRRQVLDPGPPLAWSHDKIREVTYAQLEPVRRRALHALVAEALESWPSADDAPRAAEIAHHWDAAGRADQALPRLEEAAAEAGRKHAPRERLRHLERAMELREAAGVPPEGRIRIAVDHARALEDVGRLQEASDAAAGAVQEARAAGADDGPALQHQAVLERMLGRPDRARALVNEAIDAARRAGHITNEGWALVERAGLERQVGDAGAAQLCLDRALACARQAEDEVLESRALGGLAALHNEQGRRALAREALEAALAIARRRGDLRDQLVLTANRAGQLQELGEVDAADAAFREALALARRTQDRRREGWIHYNHATLQMELGRVEEARASVDLAMAVAGEMGDRTLGALALGSRAAMLDHAGAWEEARSVYLETLQVSREIGFARLVGYLLQELGLLEETHGDPDRAWSLYQEAIEVNGSLGDWRHLALSLEKAAGFLRRVRGDLAAGRALLDRARAAFEAGQEHMGIARCIVEEGWLELREGRRPRALDLLARATDMADRVGAGPQSALRQRIAELADALGPPGRSSSPPAS